MTTQTLARICPPEPVIREYAATGVATWIVPVEPQPKMVGGRLCIEGYHGEAFFDLSETVSIREWMVFCHAPYQPGTVFIGEPWAYDKSGTATRKPQLAYSHRIATESPETMPQSIARHFPTITERECKQWKDIVFGDFRAAGYPIGWRILELAWDKQNPNYKAQSNPFCWIFKLERRES